MTGAVSGTKGTVGNFGTRPYSLFEFWGLTKDQEPARKGLSETDSSLREDWQ